MPSVVTIVVLEILPALLEIPNRLRVDLLGDSTAHAQDKDQKEDERPHRALPL